MTTSEVKCLHELEAENARLNRLLAERDLELDTIRDVLRHSSLDYMTSEEFADAHPVGAARDRYATMPSSGDTHPSAGTRDGGIPGLRRYFTWR